MTLSDRHVFVKYGLTPSEVDFGDYSISLAKMASGLRYERNGVSDLKVHLVCVNKYRTKIFTDESLEVIYKSFMELGKKMDSQLLEFNGELDCIQVLIEFPPKL
ncbi:transposase [Umezakia ovalisporum]|jgi:putative transposase|uniref:transposase n=2 Tax=Umezakia ovalisporum TaxID=75695 RepID=UPI0026A0F652